jgi:hypothetical protein
MPKIEAFAGRDMVRHATVTLTPPGTTERVPLEVGFYPNRLTMEPMASNGHVPPESLTALHGATGEQAWTNVVSFCETVASWDLTGELRDSHTTVVVADGEPVPIEPEILLYVPTWIISQVTEKLLDLAFPNRATSAGARRR